MSPTTQQLALSITKGENHRALYATHVQITSSGSEMRFIFGDMDPDFDEPQATGVRNMQKKLRVEMHTQVIVPIGLAKDFHRMLGETLTQVEDQLAAQRAGVVR